jgi:hypothetical protein
MEAAGDRIGVSANGHTGENDVVKPRPPERNPRENARSSMTVEQSKRGRDSFFPGTQSSPYKEKETEVLLVTEI